MSAPAKGRTQVLLFDLDGVLVDSAEAWLATVNAAAERFGVDPVSRERLLALFGQGPDADARTLFPGRTPAEIRAVYDAAMPAQVPAMRLGPETHAVLDDLGRRGVLRAVVTNTQASLAGRVLAHHRLLERLDAWVGVHDGLREKPAPDLLEAALRRLGREPAGACLVGDSPYDRQAAARAGVGFLHYDVRRGGSLAAVVERALRGEGRAAPGGAGDPAPARSSGR